MSEALHLKYLVTPAEMTEAQELTTQHQLGGGSKIKTWCVLGFMMLGLGAVFWNFFANEISKEHRPYVFGSIALLIWFFTWREKRRGGDAKPMAEIDLSETGIEFHNGNSHSKMPWSAFAKLMESPNLFVLMDQPRMIIFVIPKRAFPDEGSQTWFRELLGECLGKPAKVSDPALAEEPPPLPNGIALQFQLGFRDYVVRALASYQTWGLVLLIDCLMLGAMISAALEPDPKAVHSNTEVFTFFVVPFMILLTGMMILVVAFQTWRSHRGYLKLQNLVLTEALIFSDEESARAAAEWTVYTSFKETRRCFIVWNSQNSNWMMFPKRAFASPEDIVQTRAILAAKLKVSRWFFG